jgi:transaldolase
MASKLDQLREMTVVVADTGDLEAVRRLQPQDCTTNPSLVLKAIQNPAMAEHVGRAVETGRRAENPLEAIAQELTRGPGGGACQDRARVASRRRWMRSFPSTPRPPWPRRGP